MNARSTACKSCRRLRPWCAPPWLAVDASSFNLIARLAFEPLLFEAPYSLGILRVHTRLCRASSLTYSQHACSVLRLDQSAQARVGFDHTRIDPQMSAFKSPYVLSAERTTSKNPLVNLPPRPLPNHTQAGMTGRALFQSAAKKRPYRQAVPTSRVHCGGSRKIPPLAS